MGADYRRDHERISAKISQMDLFSDENRLGFDAAVQAGRIAYSDNGLVDAYYQAVSGEAFGGKD